MSAEREAMRTAIVICASHSHDCICAGCEDLYAALLRTEGERVDEAIPMATAITAYVIDNRMAPAHQIMDRVLTLILHTAPTGAKEG